MYGIAVTFSKVPPAVWFDSTSWVQGFELQEVGFRSWVQGLIGTHRQRDVDCIVAPWSCPHFVQVSCAREELAVVFVERHSQHAVCNRKAEMQAEAGLRV